MGKIISKPVTDKRAKPKGRNPARVQHALEVLDALPTRERQRVLDIYRKRNIEPHNESLSRSIAKAEEEYKSGTMLSGSIDHVLEVLNDD